MVNSPINPNPRHLMQGLVGVLAVWGVYLAIGATGVFTDVGLFNAWRSLIVLVCSAAFLVGWMWVLSRRQSRAAVDTSATSTERNLPSILSVWAMLAMIGSWCGAWLAWNMGNPGNTTYMLGGLSAALAAIGSILALVGLSDSRRSNGKLWGLVTLILLLLAGMAFVIQVRSYGNRSSNLRAVDARSATPASIALARWNE